MSLKNVVLILTLLLGALYGCEKDPVIPEGLLEGENLKSYQSIFIGERIQEDAFGFVGNFEQEEAEASLTAIIPEDARSIKIFKTDSFAWKDSLSLYRILAVDEKRLETNNTVTAALPTSDHDYFLRFTYEQNDTLHMSPSLAVRSTALTTDTLPADRITINKGSDGYTDINWPSVPATEYYYMQLMDDRGDVFLQLLLDRPTFLFYDLRRIVTLLSPPLRDPELIEGARYQVGIDAITASGWQLSHGEKYFRAP